MDDGRDACTALIVAYTHLVDHGRAAEVADLFADDGVWESDGSRYDGREAIRAAFARRQANTARTSRHVCTNVAVEVLDADTATALSYVTLYRADDDAGRRGPVQPCLVGDYVDRFVRTPEGWRFAHRRLVVAFGRLD
ncbi:MAG TPA: nuclear transport factor 2 family protein [Acidimicrobiales bacterium]|nr:nuclear transport factor 2 family protein [Acidimicrobiales bacterium]